MLGFGSVGNQGRCGEVGGDFVGTVVDSGDDEDYRDGEKHNDGRKVNRTVYANVLQLFEELRFLPVLLHFDTPFGMMILRPRGWMGKIPLARLAVFIFSFCGRFMQW